MECREGKQSHFPGVRDHDSACLQMAEVLHAYLAQSQIDFYSLMLTGPWPSQILIKIHQQGTGENKEKKRTLAGVGGNHTRSLQRDEMLIPFD